MNFIGVWHSKITGKEGAVELLSPYLRCAERQTVQGVQLHLSQSTKYRFYELRGKTKRGHYFLHSPSVSVHLEFTDATHLEGYYITKKDAGILLLECETKCQGCLEEQPNQLAHMEMGGCLYSEN